MSAISNTEARDLIERTFSEFAIFLARTRNSMRGQRMPYALSTFLMDLKDWPRINTPETRNALFKDLDANGYNCLLKQCYELADIYRLSTKNRLQGARVLEQLMPEVDSKLKKLIVQVRKFGDEELNKRLAEVESGNRFIAFEEMDNPREGYTKFENGQIKHCLNKKYEMITSEEDIWRASIILAHELQRNALTGNLDGETAEIVQKDIKFIEQLANKYGEKVYELNPEFAILRYVREKFGDDELRKFAAVVFSHEGSYFEFDFGGSRVYSFKVKDNHYTFHSESSTIEGAILNSSGLIPLLSPATEMFQHFLGFTRIEIEASRSLLEQTLANITQSLSITSDAVAVATIGSNLSGNIAVFVRAMGYIGTTITAFDIGSALFNWNRIGSDNVIMRLWGRELYARSHNGVAALYIHALKRLHDFIEDNKIGYTVNLLGEPTIQFVLGDDVVLRELQDIRYSMNENLDKLRW